MGIVQGMLGAKVDQPLRLWPMSGMRRMVAHNGDQMHHRVCAPCEAFRFVLLSHVQDRQGAWGQASGVLAKCAMAATCQAS